MTYSHHLKLTLKKKNQLLPDNETEWKRNAEGLTDTQQSLDIVTRDDNSYGPESAWDINKLTCIDNTPTNGNVNDKHGHPWKLTTTQDYNKYMQYADFRDRMMKLFDTILDKDRGKKKKSFPPHLDLTNPNSSSSWPSCGMKMTHRDLPSPCSHAKKNERFASLPHPQWFMFWKSYMSQGNTEQSLISSTLQFVLLHLFCMMN